MASSTEMFICYDHTKIGFGKLRGQPHSDLMLPENMNYRHWIIRSDTTFKYISTRDYILRKLNNTYTEPPVKPQYKRIYYGEPQTSLPTLALPEEILTVVPEEVQPAPEAAC